MLFNHVCAIKHDTTPILSFYGVFLFNVSSLHFPLNRNTSLETKVTVLLRLVGHRWHIVMLFDHVCTIYMIQHLSGVFMGCSCLTLAPLTSR